MFTITISISETSVELTPLNDRIIVKREASDAKSAGGVLLPDAAQKKPQRGKVLAVGPGKINTKDGARIPMQLKVGDVVLFTAWAGDEFEDKKNKGEVLIMQQDDVMAVLS